jgi:hypothetical protein
VYEFELIELLASPEGHVLEREEIYSRLWGYTMVRGDRSVDVLCESYVKSWRGSLPTGATSTPTSVSAIVSRLSRLMQQLRCPTRLPRPSPASSAREALGGLDFIPWRYASRFSSFRFLLLANR